MQNLKTLTLSLIIGVTLAAGVTFAAINTSWIQDGATISADSIKDALDDLQNQISAGTSNLTINNTSPTIYLQDSDHRSGMIHMNSNLMYFLRGSGTNSTSWATYNGKWPLYLNMENNEARFGGNVYADAFLYWSDKRLKNSIADLENAKNILDIQPVSFIWKVDNKKDIGVIAQEVEKYFPEFVKTDTDGYKAVDYSKLVVPLIGVVKEQEKRIKRLEDLLDKLNLE